MLKLCPSALDWVLEYFPDAPVLIGSKKCGGWFPEPSPSVLGSEWTLAWGWVGVLLPNGLSWSFLCHPSQSYHLSPFPSRRSQGSRKGCFFRAGTGFRLLPSLRFSVSAGPSQSRVLHEDIVTLSVSMECFIDLLSLSVASPVILRYRHCLYLHCSSVLLCSGTWVKIEFMSLSVGSYPYFVNFNSASVNT